MDRVYDANNITVYFGDSILSGEVVPANSCQIAMFTPYAQKNFKDHGYKTDYIMFIGNYIRAFDKLLTDDGSFFVGCIPPDVKILTEMFAIEGYKLAENLEFDVNRLGERMAGLYKWKSNPYLVFNKQGIGSGIDMDTIPYPKELQRQFILKMSKEGDTIFHPFANTAKPAAICPKFNRKCIVVSDNKYWCDVAYGRATDKTIDSLFSGDLM